MSFSIQRVSTPQQLQEAYKIRRIVFVEQDGFPLDQEIDDKDKVCIHWLIYPANSTEAVGTISKLKLTGLRVIYSFKRNWKTRKISSLS